MILARNSITLHHLRDITTVVWYYKLQSSTASAPAKPTTATPSGWTTTEPSYTEGSTNSLYVCQKTTFSDGTFEYSDVSLSSAYEAAKTAYNKSVQALDAVTPIATKTYSGLIGSANDTPNATFYFAKIHPTNYTVQWNVSLRFHVTAPEAYAQDVTIRLGGYGSAFSSYDAYTVRTGSVGMYYVSLYRATQAGISTNHKGHALGFSLKNATNPTNNSYKRTITVELLETENCTVDMLDTAVKYAQIDGTGSTNYSGTAPTEMGVATAGQNATNNTNTSYQQHGSAVKVGANGVRSYSLIMKDTDSTWSSLFGSAYNGTATGKTVCTSGFLLGSILYSAGAPSGDNYAAGANTSAVYDGYPFDFRYSSNCATTLVSYKPVYLVGEMHDDGLFYLDETWWTQTVPTAEDGKTYVYVGEAYSSYQVWLSVENPAYQYYEGKFRKLSEVEEIKASKVADNYLSSDNTGIMVADMTDGNQYTPSNVPSGVKNTFIDEDSFQVRDGTTVLASFGEESQIGKDDGNHQIINANGTQYFNAEGVRVFDVNMAGADKLVRIKSNSERLVFTPESALDGDVVLESARYGNEATTLTVLAFVSYSSMGTIRRVNFTRGTEETKTVETTVDVTTYHYYQDEWTERVEIHFEKHNPTNSSITFSFSYLYTSYCPTFSLGTRSGKEGVYSGIIGESLTASTEAQFACGRYNEDSEDYAFMIGNGSMDAGESNAYAVTWDGNQLMALDETAASGTDADLYSAITALGWESEVLV